MKNNTKLIMETWRKFLNEDPTYIESVKEPDEGFHKDGYGEAGYDPDALEEPSTVPGATEPLPGEPPFEDSVPVQHDPQMTNMGSEVVEPLDNDYDEILYTPEDEKMSSDDRDRAFDERYGPDGGDDNPFGDPDGPY